MSNALLKMAELGLTQAADVLLQNGANLNFEGQGEPRGAGEHRWLKVALPWAGSQAFGLCLTVLLGATSFISWVTTRRPTLGGLPSPCGFQVALTASGQERVCCRFCHAVGLADLPSSQLIPCSR